LKTGNRHEATGYSRKAKILGFAVCAMLFALCYSAEAQPTKVPRIGILTASTETTLNPYIEAFRQGLRDLGYIEGKNIHIEYKYSEGKSERLPALAQELVRLKVDVIVTGSASVVRATRNATSTLPIVVTNIGDLSGLVASLARPGGNVTGLTHISAELVGKRLELLKEVVPKISRVAFLKSDDATAAKAMFNDAQATARALAVQFQLLEVKVKNPDIEGTFRVIVRERIGALITESSGPVSFHRKRVLDLIEQNRIPAMHSEHEWVNAGGLMSYGANRVDLYRRAAVYVDKILKGRKPADLPVEQPTKFEFIINLKAAKQIGLTIPPNVLARADRVIK
jgi:putative tryptophan/tyrosine transport system substrate-binding protein